MPSITAHIDGGARGNPGPAGYGVFITDHAGNALAELSEYLGVQTNNVAEYSALLAALDYALRNRHSSLFVVSDSELLVKQIRGQYKVSSPHLRELYQRAMKMISQLEHFEIRHVLREKNRQADRLANTAMDRGTRAARHEPAPAPKPAAAREVNGVVKNGIVEFLGEPFPDGTLVKVRRSS